MTPWLPFDACGETVLERKFLRFHQENPHVYDSIVRWALRLRRNGAQRISVKGFLDELRNTHATKRGAGEYAINNNHARFYAEMLVKHHPELRKLVVLRRSPHADASPTERAIAEVGGLLQ